MTAVYQPSLLEAQVMPAHNGTPTSVAAAAQAIPNVGPQKRRILAYLNEQGADGSTQNQASRALNIPENTCHPRFNEMADDHWIEPTINVRPTQYGKAARVYVISSKGREVLEQLGGPVPTPLAVKDEEAVTARAEAHVERLSVSREDRVIESKREVTK